MISREEAKKYLSDKEHALRCALPHAKSGWFEETMKEIQALNMAIEAFSHERPKGRWDKPSLHGLNGKLNDLGVICSHCLKYADTDYDFCPNCGAEMVRGEEE